MNEHEADRAQYMHAADLKPQSTLQLIHEGFPLSCSYYLPLFKGKFVKTHATFMRNYSQRALAFYIPVKITFLSFWQKTAGHFRLLGFEGASPLPFSLPGSSQRYIVTGNQVQIKVQCPLHDRPSCNASSFPS